MTGSKQPRCTDCKHYDPKIHWCGLHDIPTHELCFCRKFMGAADGLRD